MQHISLKNFRRFKELKEVQFKGINFLVGKNNAGKSTLTKATMLVWDNLKHLQWENMKREAGMNTLGAEKNPTPVFHFDADTYYNLHIGNFERAKCNLLDDNRIVFNVRAGRAVEIEIVVRGDVNVNTLTAPIEMIKVSVPKNGKFIFDFSENKKMYFAPVEADTSVDEKAAEKLKDKLVEDYRLKLASLENQREVLIAEGNIIEVGRIDVKIADLQNLIDNPEQGLEEAKAFAGYMDFDLSYFHESVNENVLAQYIRTFAYLADTSDIDNLKKEKVIGTNVYKARFAERKALQSHIADFREAASEVEYALAEINIEYMHAHAATQKLILTLDENIKDVNTSVVHEFTKSQIIKDSEPDKFLSHWLREFEICKVIDVEPIAGEGYMVWAKDRIMVNDREQQETIPGRTHLADLGMGSIQMIILLMKLATVANENEKTGIKPIIILEEPEQNLHPMLQSRLAEMFYDFHKEFGNQFIIETHSEYLIRKSQVLVSEIGKKCDEEDFVFCNPFEVFYFDPFTKGSFYNMEFNKNGRFTESFKRGFFDETGVLSSELEELADELENEYTFDFSNLK